MRKAFVLGVVSETHARQTVKGRRCMGARAKGRKRRVIVVLAPYEAAQASLRDVPDFVGDDELPERMAEPDVENRGLRAATPSPSTANGTAARLGTNDEV